MSQRAFPADHGLDPVAPARPRDGAQPVGEIQEAVRRRHLTKRFVIGDFAADRRAAKFPEVERFARLMARELDQNSEKQSVQAPPLVPATAILEVYRHVAKLDRAVRDNDEEKIREHGADVGNCVLILLDTLNLLPFTTADVEAAVRAENMLANEGRNWVDTSS